jgi:Cys-rich repeat protein
VRGASIQWFTLSLGSFLMIACNNPLHLSEEPGQTCRLRSDCQALANTSNGSLSWECFGPYDTSACRRYLPGEAPVACTEDSQCSAGKVCRADPTVAAPRLGPSGLVCAAPCAGDLDCPPTDTCDSDGRCRARTCAECPSYFSCASGTCVIPSCLKDIDCPGGYCVHESCAGSLGVCKPMCF